MIAIEEGIAQSDDSIRKFDILHRVFEYRIIVAFIHPHSGVQFAGYRSNGISVNGLRDIHIFLCTTVLCNGYFPITDLINKIRSRRFTDLQDPMA